MRTLQLWATAALAANAAASPFDNHLGRRKCDPEVLTEVVTSTVTLAKEVMTKTVTHTLASEVLTELVTTTMTATETTTKTKAAKTATVTVTANARATTKTKTIAAKTATVTVTANACNNAGATSTPSLATTINSRTTPSATAFGSNSLTYSTTFSSNTPSGLLSTLSGPSRTPSATTPTTTPATTSTQAGHGHGVGGHGAGSSTTLTGSTPTSTPSGLSTGQSSGLSTPLSSITLGTFTSASTPSGLSTGHSLGSLTPGSSSTLVTSTPGSSAPLASSTPASSTILPVSTPTTSTKLATLTPTTKGTPMPTTQAPPQTSDTKPTTTKENVFSNCAARDTSSTDAVQALIDDTGFPGWLDIMLNIFPNGEKGWLNALWVWSFPKEGNSPLTGCGNINSDCNIETMCSKYPNALAYWVFDSIASLHSKLNTIHYMFGWDGWLAGLSIDQISKDFSQPKTNDDFYKWMSAAFSMTAGLGTSLAWAAELRGMISMAAAGMTMVTIGDVDNSGVDVTNVELYLKMVVSTAGNYVADIMNKAVGGDDDPSTLPIYTWTTLEHPTARFLMDNTILLDQNVDNSTFMNVYNNFGKNIEMALVDRAINTTYYVLLEDNQWDESTCASINGGVWLPIKDTSHCFYLIRPSSTESCKNDDPRTCDEGLWTPSGDKGNIMVSNYGFNLTSYYSSIIDCQTNGNGTVDMTTGVDGFARCFFTLPIYKGSFHAYAVGYSMIVWDGAAKVSSAFW